MKTATIIVICVISIIAVAVMCCLFLNNSYVMTSDKLNLAAKEIISYYSTGGMDMHNIEMSLYLLEDDIVYFSYTQENTNKKTNKCYKVSLDNYSAILDYCYEKDCFSWGILENSEYIALDAPTQRVFIKVNGVTKEFSSTQVFPEKAEGFIADIYNLLKNNIR